MALTEKQLWEEFKDRELLGIKPILERLGFELDTHQPHLLGERYLMHAVTTKSGRKLILLGKRKTDSLPVIIKATNDPKGITEIEHERLCRKILQKIRFAYDTFLSPTELVFTKQHGFVISIQAFIEQKSAFLDRPVEEQFSFALRAFKAQESTHAATYEHAKLIQNTFGSMNAAQYINRFTEFKTNILNESPEIKSLKILLDTALERLSQGKETIEQYSYFLTHTDFVPHNFRIVGDDIYLLDYSSLRFGNKYEGWARFLNFMTLYNPELEDVLLKYVRVNRTPEESESLHLMRIYRLGEIIWYYIRALQKSTDDLRVLNSARVDFWSEVLAAQLERKKVSHQILEDYKLKRDSLRSEDEKKRQENLH
jgi:hypothetical protein